MGQRRFLKKWELSKQRGPRSMFGVYILSVGSHSSASGAPPYHTSLNTQSALKCECRIVRYWQTQFTGMLLTDIHMQTYSKERCRLDHNQPLNRRQHRHFHSDKLHYTRPSSQTAKSMYYGKAKWILCAMYYIKLSSFVGLLLSTYPLIKRHAWWTEKFDVRRRMYAMTIRSSPKSNVDYEYGP